MIESGAYLSPCKTYRYSLWRRWDMFNEKYLIFVGLNPSTADATKDDPTIRRCIGFAKDFGYGGIVMLNLFAYRSTIPQKMMKAFDPVGPENNRIIEFYNTGLNDFVAVWGVWGKFMGRDKAVRKMIPNLLCFGLTQEGYPKHPLYLKKNTELIPLRD